MEDAAISELDIGGGNSIFGVFDGHGGTFIGMQVPRYRSMSRRSLWRSSKAANCTSNRNTKRP